MSQLATQTETKQPYDERTKTFHSIINYTPKPNFDNVAQYLLAAFEKNADRTLLVDATSERTWTGAQLQEASCAIAANLLDNFRLVSGEPVFVISDHYDYELLVACGIFLAGGSLFGSWPDDGFAEHQRYCEILKPRVMFISPQLHNEALELRRTVDGCGDAQIIWMDLDAGHAPANDCSNNNNTDDSDRTIARDQVLLLSDLLNSKPTANQLSALAEAQSQIKSTQDAYYCLTSGSSSQPKFVGSSQLATVNSFFAQYVSTLHTIRGEQNPDFRLIAYDRDSVLASDLPLDHGAGFVLTMVGLYVGLKSVVLPAYSAETFWTLCDKYRVTCSVSSCTFSMKLFQKLAEMIVLGQHKHLNLDSFRFVMSAGAKFNATKHVNTVAAELPHLRIIQSFGSSEVSYVSSMVIGEALQYHESVGYLAAPYKALVVDVKSGERRGPNEKGELLLNTCTLFSMYYTKLRTDGAQLREQALYRDPQTGEVYFRTGDLAHFDPDGRLYLHGRLKETLVLMTDWKISPAELEEIVNEHPLVEQSVVVGVPDYDAPGCDAPRAYVTLSKVFDAAAQSEPLKRMMYSKDHRAITADIKEFVARRVAEVKRLKGGVQIVDEFPRNGLLNKINRRVLKELALKEWQKEHNMT